MWFRGVPIDPKYQVLATDPALRQRLREALIDEIQADYPIYENSVLKSGLLGQWFTANAIPIPLTAKSRRVSTSALRLGQIAQDHTEVAPLVDALRTLSQLKEYHLPVGADGRLRAWFATFLTITSRAAPPTDEYIYNVPAWHRATMAPPEGMALAYIDWSAREFGLAAAMSHDPAMLAFYQSGDPYTAAAIAGGAIPPGSTGRTHPAERNLFKTGLLACQYGIGVKTLAARLQTSEAYARTFLALHHRLFPRYWEWSDGVVRAAIQRGEIVSRHGWRYEVHPPFNIRRLRNWPIQTLGAEILRAACIYADAAGVEMLATAHDAVLLQAPIDAIDEQVALMSDCMARASSVLTGGFVLRADTDPRNVKRGGERFLEARGASTLRVVDKFLDREARRG
jgi:DNA polymerase I-like protein with 3'-5' exonuclease and polymerase domains